MASHAAPAAHASHQETAAVGASPETPEDASGHACDCLGHCCASIVDRPQDFASTVTVPVSVAECTTGIALHEYVSMWVDFVLPFAIAPPAIALG